MSQLKFWNKQNNNNNNNNNSNNNDNSSNNSNNSNGNTAENGKNGKRNWLHTPEALINGHVVYLVKFFGNLPAEQPKGIEVVKDAIRKLQFAQQMKKAETGTQEKFKKVEITISVDGVAIQEPRTQKILHQFPLHNISYCADEKGVKKFFSFIAKNVKSPEMNGSATPDDGGTPPADTHECFVFISNKLASDITLTIGQAFDLAYKKYINNNEKTDLGKAQQQIANLEKVISIYKGRLGDLAQKLPKSELDAYLFKAGIKDVTEVPADSNTTPSMNGNGAKLNEDKLLIDTNSNHSSTKSSNTTSSYVPIVPPRNNLAQQISLKTNSQKMEELLLNSDSDSDFDPRAEESFESTGNNNNNSGSTGSAKHESNDLFGFEPSKSYGQQLFTGNSNSHSEDNKLFGSNNNYNSFSNELNFVTPPLLAPPPKVAAPRRTVANTNLINNSMTNGNTDLFGSDPFELNGANIMKSKVSPLSVDDFSLESLDPLRK